MSVWELIYQVGSQKCHLSSVNHTNVDDECEIRDYHEEVGSDNWTDTGQRYDVGSVNLSLQTFSRFLKYILSANNYRPPNWAEHADLLYYIGILVWSKANDDERTDIATVISESDYGGDELYFVINFPTLYDIIQNNTWTLCEENKFLTSTLDFDDFTQVPEAWGNEATYTIRIDTLLDEGASKVVFLCDEEWYDEAVKTFVDQVQCVEHSLFAIPPLSKIVASYFFDEVEELQID